MYTLCAGRMASHVTHGRSGRTRVLYYGDDGSCRGNTANAQLRFGILSIEYYVVFRYLFGKLAHAQPADQRLEFLKTCNPWVPT